MAASTVATDFIRSSQKIEMWDHDPGATTAIIVSPDGGTTLRTVDMSIVRNLAVAAAMSVLASGSLTKLEIVAAATAAMTDPEVIKDSGTIAADAQGDWAILECSAEEIAQAATTSGKALRYAAGRLTISNAGSEAVVIYIAIPVHAYKDLTPATTIA